MCSSFLFKNLCFPDLFSILGINSIVSICDCGHWPLDPEHSLSNQILKLQSKVRNIQNYKKTQVKNFKNAEKNGLLTQNLPFWIKSWNCSQKNSDRKDLALVFFISWFLSFLPFQFWFCLYFHFLVFLPLWHFCVASSSFLTQSLCFQIKPLHFSQKKKMLRKKK